MLKSAMREIGADGLRLLLCGNITYGRAESKVEIRPIRDCDDTRQKSLRR